MKIVADENIPLVKEFFSDMGEVSVHPGRTLKASDVEGASALIVRSVTNVNESLLVKSNISFVGTCTIGIDHLATEYLDTADIEWCSAPGCNANSVVEYVYAALADVGINWRHQKVGIIGCGNVGGALYRRLKSQNVSLRCYDPFLTSAENEDVTTLADVLACDVICMHTPLTKSGQHPTYHLIGETELALLKPGAVLINAGRGPVIDNTALLTALKKGLHATVILDVWEPEPAINVELLEHVHIGTPHIAGYSYDGKLNGTEMIYQRCCHHFNQPIKHSLSQLVPPLNADVLRIPHTLSDPFSKVQYAIKQVYDIRADDQRLREAATLSAEYGESIAERFDELRKHYPRRREFHNYNVCTDTLTAEEVSWFTAIGFNCV